MTPQRAAAVVAVALLVWSVPAGAQRLTIRSVEAVERWAEAVEVHVPGEPDASVAAMAAVTYGARVHLNTSYPLFVQVLHTPDRIEPRNELEARIVALGARIRRTPGAPAFLERAAILHLDAVVFARRFPAVRDEAPRSRAGESSPLLTRETVTLTRDGQIVGGMLTNWNLPFARSVLDEMGTLPAGMVTPQDRAFVSDWYHAVSAYLFANGMNADATSHLAAAARAWPDDGHALFDRATYAEAFGLPIYQAVRDEAADLRSVSARLPSEEKTNAEAERLYLRVLDVDPASVEARVRLARLLERRGQHEEAAAQLGKALAAQPAGVVAYYAHLFAGRVAAARGRHDEALRQYREASALYADAQAPRLGASQASLMLGDIPQALAALEHIGREDPAPPDPWWYYRLGAGRDVKALLAALWSRAKAR